MSAWQVSKTVAAGEVFYQVVRKINDDEVDHSGNREIRGTFKSYELAKIEADAMNGGKKDD